MQQHQYVSRYSSSASQTVRPFGNITQSRTSHPIDDVPLTAVIVPIGRLEAVRTLVRVSGKTIRVSDPKPYKDKRDPPHILWTQSATIKDDRDTIDIKIWYRSQEHVRLYQWLKLDLVIHVWTDDVKIRTTDAAKGTTSTTSNAAMVVVPTTTSPLVMTLSVGKHGHQIVAGSQDENDTLFRTALGANAGGIIPSCFHLEHLLGGAASTGTSPSDCGDFYSIQQQRPNLPLLVKKVGAEMPVRTRFGDTCKRTLTVTDGQWREARLTLWGAVMARSVEGWVPNETVLILTAPKVGVYNRMPDVSVGFQTHVQVNPVCKTTEWLRHAASQFGAEDQRDGQAQAAAVEMPLENITKFYSIVDIARTIPTLSSLGTAFGYMIGVISQLDIEQRSSELMSSVCPTCRRRVTSHRITVCAACNAEPPAEGWKLTLNKFISFMDDTGELCHPIVDSNVAQALLGFSASEFSGLSITERTQVKARLFLERFKVFFKIIWSDFRRRQTIEVVAIEPPVLSDCALKAQKNGGMQGCLERRTRSLPPSAS